MTGPVGSGGHQNLHGCRVEELGANNNAVTFDDCQLGELIRLMTLYKGADSKRGYATRFSVRSGSCLTARAPKRRKIVTTRKR